MPTARKTLAERHVARLSRALARRQVVVASHAAGQGRGQIWLELHVAQGSPLACLVWFGVCSQPASAEGCTLDLPHSPGASITINHRHMYLLRTMALGRLGKKAAPLAGIVTLPSPSASASASAYPAHPALSCPVLCISMFARHPLVDPFAVLTTTAPWPSH